MSDPRNLTPEECIELTEMVRAVNSAKWVAEVVKGNTYRIRGNGQRHAQQLEDVATLLEEQRHAWITRKIRECGYESGTGTINLSTGAITRIDNEPKTS